MSAPDSASRPATLALAAALFGLLFCLYLLTYSGVFNSDDERYLFDTTESIVERRTLFLNQTTYIRPFRTSGAEVAQPLLAAPFYFAADRLSFVGTVQTTFLFNPLVTALTAVLVLFFALDMGYSRGVALAAALLFGATTIAWPYTKTFFREPLAGLSLFASLFFLRRWRESLASGAGRQNAVWLAAGMAAFLTSIFTKEAALIAAPVVVAYALPSLGKLQSNRSSLLFLAAGVLGVAAILLGLVTALRSIQGLSGRFAFLHELDNLVEGLGGSGEGIAGFLLSPGKSVFVYSPVALLAMGAFFVPQPERRRETWLAAGMLAVFAVTYSAVQGELWHGGSGWGPRYLVPVTPVLVLGGLPVVKRALHATTLWPKLGLAALGLLGALVQIPGLLINIHDYYEELSPLGPGAPWTIAVWQVKYSQVLGHLRLARDLPPDLAWVRPAPDPLAIWVLLAGAALFAGGLVWLSRQALSGRRAAWAIAGSLLVVAGLTVFALRRAYDDPYFNGDDEHLHELLAFLDQAAAPDDAIVLSNPRYVNFFANYYKANTIWFAMPRSPGERHSPDEEALVVSDDPDELVSPEATTLIRFAARYAPTHRVWLVVDGGPYTPWYPRPPEWWAAEHSYTVQSREFAPTVRVVEYVGRFELGESQPPANPLGVRLGEDIVLDGYALLDLTREAEQFHAGDGLALSLAWHADQTPDEDYVVAVFIAGPDGQIVLQQDRTPVATFRPTTTWQPGETIRDNYGFVLPPDLSPGHYEVWVAMYRWPSLERLPATTAEGDDGGDLLTIASFEVLPLDEAGP